MPRKKKEFSWEAVEALVQAGCTQEDISEILNISIDTLQRACKRDYGANFSDHFKHLFAKHVKLKLKNAIIEKALSGDTTAQIWASKNLLGWSDKGNMHDNDGTNPHYTIELRIEQGKFNADKQYELTEAEILHSPNVKLLTEQRTPETVSSEQNI